MRKLTIALLTTLVLAGGVAVPAGPAAAEADCIESCDEDFPGGTPILISIRGWCYIIRCSLS